MNENGFDYIIISAASAQQRSYWTRRLKYTLPTICGKQPKIIAIEENWSKEKATAGAGNGLGTLYAIQTAAERDEELFSNLEKGASIGIFHTAGFGKQMHPLVASERGNKAAIIVPGQTQQFNLTLLESIIKQSMPYAFAGRVSVFCADQLFLSPKPPLAPTAHIELYGVTQATPDKTLWKEKKLSQSGLIAKHPDGRWQLFDGIRFSAYEKLVEKKVIDPEAEFGYSLGCFSMSSHALNLLLNEFSPELNRREGFLETDKHFWMAALLDKKVYSALCGEENLAQYDRMQNLLKRVNINRMPFFNVQNLDAKTYFWDLGNVLSYYTNLQKLVKKNAESAAFKELFGIDESKPIPGLDIDANSILINCKIQQGTIRNSILINVVANQVNCIDSVLIDVLSPKIDSSKALLYHCTSRETLHMANQSVRCDVFDAENKKFKPIETSLNRDGKEDWDEKIGHNAFSYAELYEMNRNLSMERTEIIWFKERQAIGHDILKLPDNDGSLLT